MSLLLAAQTGGVDGERVVALDVVQAGLDQRPVRSEEEDSPVVASVGAVVTGGVDGLAGLGAAPSADDLLFRRQLRAGVVHAALDDVVADDLAERHQVHVPDGARVLFTLEALLLRIDAERALEGRRLLLVLALLVLRAARAATQGERQGDGGHKRERGVADLLEVGHSQFSLQSVALLALGPSVWIWSGRSAERKSSERYERASAL